MTFFIFIFFPLFLLLGAVGLGSVCLVDLCPFAVHGEDSGLSSCFQASYEWCLRCCLTCVGFLFSAPWRRDGGRGCWWRPPHSHQAPNMDRERAECCTRRRHCKGALAHASGGTHMT